MGLSKMCISEQTKMLSPCSLSGPPSFPLLKAVPCKQTHLVPNWPGLRLKVFLAGPILRRSLLKSKLLQALRKLISELTASQGYYGRIG